MASKKQNFRTPKAQSVGKTARTKPARAAGQQRTASKRRPDPAQSTLSQGAPRETKQAQIITLLSRPAGATLGDLISATGWLPHTTRAALTGLRKKGYTLEKSRGEDGKTTYRISSAPTSGKAVGEVA
jgi:DNA-binding MarR family transcriptional regulator